MDAIFNSKFMQAIQKAGQKIGSYNFVGALQGAMMSLMGALMVGAIVQIIQNVLTIFHVIKKGDAWSNYLNIPYQFTMGMLAVWVTLFLAYQYSRSLKMRAPITTTLDALIVFLIVAAPLTVDKAGTYHINMGFLGASGMFIGFLVAGVVVRIEKFCADKNIRIKMPDVVPKFLSDGFSAILPLVFEVIIFGGISIIISAATGGKLDLASGFVALLSAPLKVLLSTPGIFVLLFIACVLWSFGIHGTLIIATVILPVSIQATVLNGQLHAAGKALKYNPVFLMGGLACAGGTGNTFPLVLMGLRAKSKQIKAVSRASLIPGWFNINEPVTFGMPVMYNPLLAIPYTLNVLVVAALWLVGFKTGLLGLPMIPITTALPIGFAEYFGSLNVINFIWAYLMILVAGLIWYPFYKAYDNQLYKKEQAEAKAEVKK